MKNTKDSGKDKKSFLKKKPKNEKIKKPHKTKTQTQGPTMNHSGLLNRLTHQVLRALEHALVMTVKHALKLLQPRKGYVLNVEKIRSMTGAGNGKTVTINKPTQQTQQQEQPQPITLTSISGDEWVQIHYLASKHAEKGVFKAHNGKCWIAGFVQWLDYNQKMLVPEDSIDDFPAVH